MQPPKQSMERLKSSIPEAIQRVVNRVGNLALGAFYSGVGLTTGYMVGTGSGILTDRFALTSTDAQPSNLFSDVFEGVVKGSTVVGAAYAVTIGAQKIHETFNTAAAAKAEIAAKDRPRHSPLQKIGASVLSITAAGLFGLSIDSAAGLSSSQVDASNMLKETIGNNAYIVTNSPYPQLATTNYVAPEVLGRLVDYSQTEEAKSQYSNVSFIPVHYSWQNIRKNGAPKDALVPALLFSMPAETLGMPDANSNCSYVPVAVAEEFGLKKDDTFEMEGVKLTVVDTIKNSAGANLLPVTTTNTSANECIANNPISPYNLLLVKGDVGEIKNILEKIRADATNPSERTYLLPLDNFFANTAQAGKNNVNGTVLPFLAMSALFAGAAIAGKRKTELAIQEGQLRYLLNSNFRVKDIRSIGQKRACMDTLTSTVAGLALTVGLDYTINAGLPGAQIGPNGTTGLAILGIMGGINYAATRSATHKILRKDINQNRGLAT